MAERIEAVAIDITTAYELEIKEQCPQAEIVFDLYHVVAKYGREVIDRVRWIRPTNCDMTSRPQGSEVQSLVAAAQPS
ncbi:transposase family protein [Burkholderia pseudomallei]|nr:transposase family protein [Burkholderia pseudomallei]